MSAAIIPFPNQRPAMDKLQKFLDERRRACKPSSSFEEFEEQHHRLMSEAEAEAVGEELARHDVDRPTVGIDGVEHRRVVRCEQEYFTPAGPVRQIRSLYGSAPGEATVCPMELSAGIVEGRWTPRAAKQALWFVAQLTPKSVEELYQRLGGLMPSKTSLDRLPKKVSQRWEQERKRYETRLREREEIPERAESVGISLDGVMVPMKDGERREKREEAAAEGKRTRGSAGYQEVGCGTLTFYDRDGEMLSAIRLGRMPEANKRKEAWTNQSLAAYIFPKERVRRGSLCGSRNGAGTRWELGTRKGPHSRRLPPSSRRRRRTAGTSGRSWRWMSKRKLDSPPMASS